MNKSQLNHFEYRANQIIKEELDKRFPDKRKALPNPEQLFEGASATAVGKVVIQYAKGGRYLSGIKEEVGKMLPAYVKAKDANEALEKERLESIAGVSDRMKAKRDALVDGYMFGDDTSIADALATLRSIK